MKHWMKSLMVVWVCICVACAPLAVLGAESPQGGTIELYTTIRNESTGVISDMDWQSEYEVFRTIVTSDTLYSFPFRSAPVQFHSGLFYTVDFGRWTFSRIFTDELTGLYQTTMNLNLRESPDANSSRLDLIPQGAQIRLTSVENGWGRTFYNGYWGYVSMDFVVSVDPDLPADEIISTVQLHLHSTNGYWVSSKHNILSDGSLNVPAVSWYCTESFECDALYFSFTCTDGSSSEVWVSIPPIFSYSYTTELQQMEGILSSQTDRIISGDGLTPPAGIPDQKEDIEGSLDDYTSAEKDVETALGGGGFGGAKDQLDSIMQLPALGPDFTAAFAKINTVFSRVVSTFDLSVALTFMLIFGLALFVIGRRVR